MELLNFLEGEITLEEVKEDYKVEELISGRLWVAYRGSLEFRFLELNYIVDDNLVVTCFWYGSGVQSLRECRHSYLGEKGYIFYMNFAHMRAALAWLEKYFDGD